MKIATKTLAIAMALAATVAMAKDGTQDPTVKARQDLMGTIGMNVKTLGDMAGGKAPFDAAAAGAAREALVAASADIGPKFETQADDPMSEVIVDKVWANFEDFKARGMALNAAATALDVTSVETLQAGMGAVGGACRDCHTEYRAKR
ncbi:MAG: cytochrome c [Paracoccaceae bacterium]|nr:MAG: cytochrome c [Paracoccaceae bacterium]